MFLGVALVTGACRKPDEGALLSAQAPRTPSMDQRPAAVVQPIPSVRLPPAARTPCEISYEQTKAFLADAPPPPLASEGTEKGRATTLEPSLAPREQYLRACEEMPRKVQECLVFDYAMAHEEECRIARAEYDQSPGG